MNQAKENTARKEEEFDLPEDSSLTDDIDSIINRLEGDIDEEEGDGLQGQEETVEEGQEQQAQQEEVKQPETQAKKPPGAKYTPPLDWDDNLKKEWASLPEPVQRRVHEREVQVKQMLQQTASQRRLADQFMQVVEPFRGLMAAEGVQNPLQAVQGLMTTTAQLAMGPPEVKAKKIAELIQHYKIDIEMLDKTLAGQMPENPEMDRFQQMLDQRLGGIEQRFNQMEQTRRQAMQQSAAQSIQEFGADPKHEFFPQVRMIMADFLDLATRNGQRMSLDEAYTRACAAHPEVSKVMAQRNIQQGAPRVDQKRRAASSVRGGSVSTPEARSFEDMDLRDILEKQVPGGDSRI